MTFLQILVIVIYLMFGLKVVVRVVKSLVKREKFLNDSNVTLITGIVIVHILLGLGWMAYLFVRGLVHASL